MKRYGEGCLKGCRHTCKKGQGTGREQVMGLGTEVEGTTGLVTTYLGRQRGLATRARHTRHVHMALGPTELLTGRS